MVAVGCDRTLKMHTWCMLLALEVPAAALSLACILTYGTITGHNQQQRSRSRALVLLHQAQHILRVW